MGDTFSQMGRWRKMFWPFQSHEMKKMGPMMLMKFFISMSFAILTSIKDTATITAPGSSAETIPALKALLVLPASILAVLAYAKLSTHVKRSTLFYSVVTTFIVVFFLIGFVFYPNAASLSPKESAEWLLSILGPKHGHWVAIYQNWIPTLLFIMSELWGQIGIMLLFWGFANQVSSVSEAKRSYNLYIAAGDVATMIIGFVTAAVSIKAMKLGLDYTRPIQIYLGMVIIQSFFVMILYRYCQRFIPPTQTAIIPEKAPLLKPKKPTLVQSIKHIFSSPHLFGIALIVIAQGFVVAPMDTMWKASVKMLHSDSNAFQNMTSFNGIWVGALSFIISLFFGANIIHRLGWRFSALITPAIVCGCGLLFFGCVYVASSFSSAPISTSLLMPIIIIGTIQVILNKTLKYSFFDSTKEIAYIPLDPDAKTRGKAAIDVVGSRFGKSWGSWFQIMIIDFIGTGSILMSAQYFIPTLLAAGFVWIYGVRMIDKQLTLKESPAEQKVTSS